MKHFGHLKGIAFTKNDEQELANRLINDGLFVGRHIGQNSGFKDGILEFTFDPKTVVADPVDDLVDEYYDFLMTIYKYDIALDKLSFFKEFNDIIFGLEYNQQKTIALQHFKEIYDDIYVDAMTFFTEEKSENGIVHSYNFSKLKMLSYQYRAFKFNAISKINMYYYLQGNEDFYRKENLSEKFDLAEELYFESQLQILVELNDRYKFEEDLYFTQIRLDKKKFAEYEHIFKTLKSYQFTNRKIKSFKEDHKAHIESLYEVLSSKELINDHKENFMLFLKNEYNLNISKIINYEKKVNFLHNERVTLFKSDWANITSEK